MADRYEPQKFEAKWRKRWKEADLFRTREEEGRPKFYCLDFFPYPSGAGLSVGHCRNYIPGDVLARMKYMQGHNVLHPMGFDAFGLPAENEAIKNKVAPGPMVEKYAQNYRRQLDLVGIGYDWSRSFNSSDPRYYRWTEWIFELLYKRGLAYRRLASVNWCETDRTVLADEEVVGGLCWRCGNPVEKKWIPQWFFKITEYAQRLIDDLDTVDWPEGIKLQQKNWIGRSEGVRFWMSVALGRDPRRPTDYELPANTHERRLGLEVFTTRIDTIFGMTFCVLAPEHPLVDTLIQLAEGTTQTAESTTRHAQGKAMREYREKATPLSETDRQAACREKTGVFTGFYAINPANGRRVPIWIADYVMIGYGTGAIMAVPAGDQRDLEFATKFDLPVTPIQKPTPEFFRQFGEEPYDEALARYLADPKQFGQAFTDKEQPLIDAGEYTGMNCEQATKALGEWMEALGIGERKIQYKLRDWLISRQRYWGCPIPIIHTKEGDVEMVPEECLPVLLPEVDNYEPAGDGSSPLARIEEFVNVTDSNGSLGRRETDTMGGFACSSWYFLRFCDPHNDGEAWSRKEVDYWMPVDCYIGGAEHAVMHLLYARFWMKVFFDAGLVTQNEPFARLQNQGQVLARTPYRRPRTDEQLQVGEDAIQISFAEAASMPKDRVIWKWARMSKSKGNVVTPDEVVEKEGADALRLYELFVAPFVADVEWSSEGLQGQVRFLGRIFRLMNEARAHWEPTWRAHIAFVDMASGRCREIRRLTHQTIAGVSQKIDAFHFNTYISDLMEFVNGLGDHMKAIKEPTTEDQLAISEAMETLILLLSPAAPHTADELWESLAMEGFTYQQDWPKADMLLAKEDLVMIVVQINGKVRDNIEMSPESTNEQLERAALASEKVRSYLDGNTVRKVIVVPGKLVNIVAN